MVLGLLLARHGVAVTVLEAKNDFERAFRGDTVHPSTLEMLDDLGLADRLLALDHARLSQMSLRSGDHTLTLADFRHVRTRFPFIAMIPQSRFLDFIAREANAFDGFDLRMGARATALIEDAGVVNGIRYQDATGTHSVEADLTVGADGRGSRVRRLGGFAVQQNAAAMDVLWLVVPRRVGEDGQHLTGFRVGRGRLVVVLARETEWQLGYVILKGDRRAVQDAGLEAVRADIAALVPEFCDRVDTIQEWSDLHFLSVESNRARTWHRPGLLLIGDAAHVMSPIGGVGINYAIQDAVATANLLTRPLLSGVVTEAQLAAVQRRREWPTRVIQRVQRLIQRQLVARALRDEPFRLPLLATLVSTIPILRTLPAWLVGWGVRPERVVLDDD